MSTDNNDKTRGLLANPLPIVMVALLAAGVLAKNVPLESARPIDPERVKFISTTQQDVEARLWQDPFAAIEKHEERFAQTAKKHIQALHERIEQLSLGPNRLTIVAVSVFGDSFDEAAESRRRSRFAVISALEFHHYHPEEAGAIGYISINLSKSDRPEQRVIVPYEWFDGEKQSKVLVLWLNESRFSTTPRDKLNKFFNKLLPPKGHSLEVKLVGPASSANLVKLVDQTQKAAMLNSDIMLQIFSPSATISNCELLPETQRKMGFGECFNTDFPIGELNIVRTSGTDDMLAAALLWELWQRDVNRESWWQGLKRAQLVNNEKSSSPKRTCKDGLVLISELDSRYARTLSQYLTDGFLSFCGTDPNAAKPVRTFTYLRGLDGVLPDIKKSDTNAPHKDDDGKSKDLRAQLKDVPLEHAEGRSQYDYLRRLADEIERLNSDKQFTENGIKAIGIVGSDQYDKLLILQALRSRFKDKIFFTTDLDARYLHADQKGWARNLVVASNFGLTLRPELQHSTLPFRDSYQTATYLATLMALENERFDYWTGKMKQWLHPQIFEIGRTEAVHLASPTVDDLTVWSHGIDPRGTISPKTYIPCDQNYWAKCMDIEPARPLLRPSFEHWFAIFLMIVLGFLLIVMASRHVRETLRAVKDALSPPVDAKAIKLLLTGVGLLVLGGAVLAYIISEMNTSLTLGIGEPFVWLEGTSVWPSVVLRFIGFVLTLVFALMLWIRIRRKARLISKYFNFALPQTWTLKRSRWSAMWTGPYLDLTSFNREGKADPKPMGTEVEIATLWQNYLRATSMREMIWWIVFSTVIVALLFWAAYPVFDMPSFPHRGQLVERLDHILVSINALILWPVIFWVSYQTRACAQFIKILSNVKSEWPEPLLKDKEDETGVPRAYLADYLEFQLIMRATQRIHWLIYLPFISILFIVIARSDLFDAMNFPLALIFVIGLVLVYALCSEVLLRRVAVAARTKALDHYETRLLRMQAAPKKDNCNSTEPPISAEQIKLLMERIRSTREGVFAPITEQPALRALLLPFGGFGGAQLIEYLINLTV